MKKTTSLHLECLIKSYPELEPIRGDIITAFELLSKAFLANGKLLVCGNGGSSSDADHIAGELMKGFLLKRPIDLETILRIRQIDPESKLPELLQSALPAINLSAHTALITAISNDINYDMVYAQQLLGYGEKGDVFIGISTSGNSRNVNNAAVVAKALDIKTIGLTGFSGGEMSDLYDLIIRVPANETTRIQELHLPIYHALCAMLEEEFFGKRDTL